MEVFAVMGQTDSRMDTRWLHTHYLQDTARGNNYSSILFQSLSC